MLPNDFADFLRLLNSHRVEYLLVGGYAVCYHGYYRNTNDIDIWVAVNAQNAAKLVRLIKEFGFDVPELKEELFLNKGRMIRMGIEPNRIELLTEISACGFDACYARRVIGEMGGIPVNLISLRDLKTNKRATGRNKDLADLDYLP
ncbi:MAG: hypothetical protein HYY23_07120 [Verrucomicrobia bacterium]|nr:hypothetical protein [Verrucomicrobiota bacterium]